MRRWALLLSAIIAELIGTLALRAVQDQRAWVVVVIAGYVAAFFLLIQLLRDGMPVGVLYGLWGALGTALTAIMATVIFGDPFTTPVIVGIGLIIAGVLMVELGSPDEAEAAQR